mmetsp:Transcript_2663/g.7478  ORF Transcript_2663/g.7478 Transcript_2663/m.7478 type:complete len:212 (-) Transcript_2663:191-826(-)
MTSPPAASKARCSGCCAIRTCSRILRLSPPRIRFPKLTVSGWGSLLHRFSGEPLSWPSEPLLESRMCRKSGRKSSRTRHSMPLPRSVYSRQRHTPPPACEASAPASTSRKRGRIEKCWKSCPMSTRRERMSSATSWRCLRMVRQVHTQTMPRSVWICIFLSNCWSWAHSKSFSIGVTSLRWSRSTTTSTLLLYQQASRLLMYPWDVRMTWW